MISFRTKIKTKPKHELAISSFRGVDLTSNETKIDTARASEMINFLPDNGGLRKRRGYEQVLAVPDELPINGIYRYSETILIVHAGARFFEFTQTGSNYTRRELAGSHVTSRITNTKSYSFQRDGKLFIVGCGDYLVYGDFGTGNKVLLPVTDCTDDLYVPTTTINIDCLGTKNDVRATLEGVNLLSSWRKNTLVGPSEFEEGGSSEFLVDGSIDEGTTVVIQGEVEKRVYEENAWKTYIEKVLYRTFVSGGQPTPEHTPLMQVTDGETIQVGFVNYSAGLIHLDVHAKPPIDGQSNLTVNFSHTVSGSKERVRKCTCAALFGVGGDNCTLILAGNPDEKNVQFYSEPSSWFYFPDQNVTALGSDAAEIKGMFRIDEKTLVTVKGGEEADTVYYQYGQWKDVYDGKGALVDMYQIFPSSAGVIGEKIISKDICVLFGDPLLICKNGVYGLQMTENGTMIFRQLQERSRNIRSILRSSNLTASTAIVFDGKFYLSMNDEAGTVYVADASLICYPQDSALKQRQYEWFVLKNIKARVWTEINHDLWFGTPDGRICKVSDDYMDSITGSPAVSVSALWMSAAIDCGDSSVSKTLLSVTANVENTATEVKVGVKTANREKRKNIKGLEALDFGDFDMDRLSLYNEFPDTYTVRMKERNFNFVKFRISSTQAGPCRINGLSALYKINKQNKGVR